MVRVRYHWRFGRHSKIPVCCIIAFILGWTRKVPWTGERYANCWGCYWLYRLRLRRYHPIHGCSPLRRECDEWTRGFPHVFVDGQWMVVVRATTLNVEHDIIIDGKQYKIVYSAISASP